MLILGITGGVGSGKSKILYDLSNLYGAYIVETDKLAHTLMEPGQTVYQAVVEAFGTEILQAEEPYAIDRAKFAQIVFADKEKLAQLNALTHPAVKAWIRKDIEEKRKQDVKIYVIEAALLIQDGYKEICDEIWYIYVDEETRIKRLMKQRGYTEERCRAMFHSQEPESYYRKYADFTINNQLDWENRLISGGNRRGNSEISGTFNIWTGHRYAEYRRYSRIQRTGAVSCSCDGCQIP